MGLFPTRVPRPCPSGAQPRRTLAVPPRLQNSVVADAARQNQTGRAHRVHPPVGDADGRGDAAAARIAPVAGADGEPCPRSGSSRRWPRPSKAAARCPRRWRRIPRCSARSTSTWSRRAKSGGILEVVLRRQAEFMEKALKIKGKIKAAMFYPMAVMVVAAGILTLAAGFHHSAVPGGL